MVTKHEKYGKFIMHQLVCKKIVIMKHVWLNGLHKWKVRLEDIPQHKYSYAEKYNVELWKKEPVNKLNKNDLLYGI